MAARDERLQSLLDQLCRSIAADAARSAETERVMNCVAARLGSVPAGVTPPAPVRFPVCDLLDQALLPETPLSAALRAISADLAWYRRPGGDARFQQSHANTVLVGPNGLEPREDLWIGATLLAPNTDYPIHHHPPEEVYLVLSEGDWWREGTGWFTPGIGGTLYNPPDVRHAMRSQARPLLALWALPL
jgi:mannose-6-phosphate isomerase-like protein (cupin superfamily)